MGGADGMRWASAVSERGRLEEAFDEVAERVGDGLGGRRPDLVTAFVTPHHQERYRRLPELVAERFGPQVFLGCTAAGVIGGGREVELDVGLSLTAGCLPGAALTPFHIEDGDLPDADRGPGVWYEALGVAPEPPASFVLLVDPYTFDPHDLLMGLDFAYAGGAKVGGLASAGHGNVLFLDRRLQPSGAVGVAVQGDVSVDPIVAQGCRPVGPPLTITACRRNLLVEVDGRRPTEVLADIYQDLDERQQKLFRHALHLGVASTALGEQGRAPEFLIRNIIGADTAQGILAVGALLRTGQTVRFHVRDATTADEDLSELLSRYRADHPAAAPGGALLFSCTGRGEGLYGHGNHDTDTFREVLGDVPVGGFFCGGEIGPVGADTHLHGYTSAFGIFRPAAPAGGA